MAQASNYYICRLCGYIHKGKPTGPCPACGAPVSSFVSFALGVEEKRYNFLRLDLHPIATHFGVGLAILLVLDFLVVMVIKPVIFNIQLGYGGVLDFLTLLLPLFVGLTALSGYFDGKYRYKKITTMFLKRKLLLGIMYFAVSVVIPIVHFGSAMGSNVALVAFEGVLIFVAIVLALMLGRIGGELTCHAVPRGHEVFKDQETDQPQESE
jgi:hypothetical protein